MWLRNSEAFERDGELIERVRDRGPNRRRDKLHKRGNRAKALERLRLSDGLLHRRQLGVDWTDGLNQLSPRDPSGVTRLRRSR